MSTDALINFVLDRSGSMGSLAKATIDGFNAFIDEQRNLPGNAYLTLNLFDTSFDIRFKAASLKMVDPMSTGGTNPYHIGGGTALYDAVGESIREVESWLAANPSFGGKVVTVILTDGEENSSGVWNIDQLNALIKDKQENHGWEFVFLGTGGSAWTEGQKFTSIPSQQQVHLRHDAVSTGGTYAGVSRSLVGSRMRGMSMASTLHTNTADVNTLATTPATTPAPVVEDEEEEKTP